MIYICFGLKITFASCFRISKAHGWGTHSWNVTTSSSYTTLFWEWPTLVHYLHFTKLACPPNSLEGRQWDTSSPADSIVYGKWSMVFFKGVRWLLKHYTVKDPQPCSCCWHGKVEEIWSRFPPYSLLNPLHHPSGPSWYHQIILLPTCKWFDAQDLIPLLVLSFWSFDAHVWDVLKSGNTWYPWVWVELSHQVWVML
jgi:hypothetical protein